MKKNFIKNKLLSYGLLMRIDQPIGIFLLLWPTLWALWIATPGFPPLSILLVFIIGVFLMRSAGCVINDYIDYKFDGQIKRTAKRPLPRGVVTKKEAQILFIILVFLAFLLELTLKKTVILLSIAALVSAGSYPFMKRYIYFPQIILGITFGWSILMAFIAVNESISLSGWLIFLTNVLWVVSYDTQYAMVDRDDDLKIGIKSTAILFGNKDKLVIGILQSMMLSLMIAIGYLNSLDFKFYYSLTIAGCFFVYQQKLITNRKRDKCFRAFVNNNYVGLIIFLGLVTNY